MVTHQPKNSLTNQSKCDKDLGTFIMAIQKNIAVIYIMAPRRKSMRKMRNSKKPRVNKSYRKTRRVNTIKKRSMRSKMNLHKLLTNIL